MRRRSLLDAIDTFAVAVGPGSFTGLRIGIASVEGLAFAAGRPVVGVSTLEAIAYRYRFHNGLIASVLDARRGEIFIRSILHLVSKFQSAGCGEGIVIEHFIEVAHAEEHDGVANLALGVVKLPHCGRGGGLLGHRADCTLNG